MRQVELRSGLDFPAGNQDYVIFRDQLSGLEYIRNCADISRNGLFFNLEAYKVHVFTDFQIVHDDNKKEWRHLCDFLNGRGTPDVEQLKLELPLKPILQPMREIYNAGYFNFLLAQLPSAEPGENLERLVGEAAFKMENLLQGARVIAGTDQNRAVELDVFRKKIEIMFGLITGKLTSDPCLTLRQKERVAELDATAIRPLWLPLVSWIFLDTLRIDLDMSLESFNEQIKRWRFATVIDTAFWETIATGISPAESVRMTKMLLLFSGWLKKSENKKLNKQIIELFPHEHFIEFMQVNEYNGVTWFRKESADTLIKLLLITGIIELVLEPCEDRRGKSILSRRLFTACQILESAIDKSSYDLNRLRDLLI
jgi:hypothetical protein